MKLKLDKITHYYGNSLIFDNIQTQFETGGFYTLVGPNGVGKSTLMRIMMGLEDPSSGLVRLDEHDIVSKAVLTNYVLNFVGEKNQYQTIGSIENFVGHYSKMFKKWDETYSKQIREVLNFSFKKKFNDLSRGQKMQFALFLTLSSRVDFLFIDEITSVLDIGVRDYFVREIKNQIKHGATVFFSTNILEDLNDNCKEMIFLGNHKILFQGSSDDFGKSHRIIRLLKDQNNPIANDKNCYQIENDLSTDTYFIAPISLIDHYQLNSDCVLDNQILLKQIYKYFIHRASEAGHAAA